MHTKGENPGLELDYMRFSSETWKSYADNQLQAIRAHADSRQFVTTNTMGWFAGFDHYALHQDLDLAAWDDYIPTGLYDWVDNGARHDLVRGFKRQNFWVMETQPAFVNWGAVNRALDPGQTREMAWQAVGHGADTVLYWQWRSALNGQEQYHGVLVGADGTPVPVYAEVARTAAEFERAAPILAGTSPHAEVAMLHDYDSRWAIGFQRHNAKFDPTAEFVDVYRPLRTGAQTVDILSPHESLAGYKLVVAPALNVLTEEEARRLADYVRGGGHLVLGPRSGMKDAFNALNVQRQPGPLADLLGGRVEQFYSLDGVVPVDGPAGSGKAQTWAEALSVKAPDTQVQLTYGRSGRWTDGQPAMITRQVGKGRITYLGAWLDTPTMAEVANGWLKDAGVEPKLVGVPDDVEVCERVGRSSRVLILINHAAEVRSVTLPTSMQDVLSGTTKVGGLTLAPHDVVVLR
jgi:beta-galactosidase